MEETLLFNSDKFECLIIENTPTQIYACVECSFITMGSNVESCVESRNQHMEKTGHTMKRIW